MPITISTRPLRTRQAVTANPTGGYSVAERPDPNSGIATYDRNAVSKPNDLGIGLMQRGMATSQAEDAAHAQDAFHRGVLTNIVARDPKWQGLFQALAEAGANKVRTGSAAEWDAEGASPGFFESQPSQMSRAVNTMSPRERALMDAMKKNPYAT